MSNLKRFLSKAKAMSKSALSVVLALCLLMLMIPTALLVAADQPWDGTTKTPYSGTGSVDDPFVIENGEHLAYMAERVNGGNDKSSYFQLAADIDLNDQEWTAIGNATHQFSGTLDGKGHTITGLKVTGTVSGVGFFGRTGSGAVIKNVSLEGYSLVNQNNCGAGFVGYVRGNLTISNCTFSGTVEGKPSNDGAYVGAFVGYVNGNYTVKIENCAAVNTTVITHKAGSTERHATGGLVGIASGGADLSITGSSFSGNITGGTGTGGLLGVIQYGGTNDPTNVTIKKSYSTGTITTSSGNSGGLVGHLRVDQASNAAKENKLTVEDSYSVATLVTSATGSGLVGSNYGWRDYPDNNTVTIKNSFFAGSAKYPIINRSKTNASEQTDMIVNLTDVFYLEGSATTENSLTPATDYEKSATAFTDGTVLALLNNGRNVWVQGTSYPTLAKPPEMTNLAVDKGVLIFDANKTEYNLVFQNSVTLLSVTPTVEDGTTVTINGEAATSGTAKSINLTANNTTVIEVTISRDNIVKTYTINATCANIWDGTTATLYPNAAEADAGTAANPYQISSPEHLAYLAQQVNAGTNYAGKYFTLMNDINLGNQPWTRIGGTFSGTNYTFSGIFDGDGHTISGLKIQSGTDSGVGLFGRTGSGAVIKDLHLEGNITSEGPRVAGFVGEAAGNLTISGCTFTGSVQGKSALSSDDNVGVGGVVGCIWGNHTVKIEDTVLTNANVTVLRGLCGWAGVQGGGGMVGMACRGADVFITNSSFDGNIIGESANGGLVGLILDGESGDPTIVNIDHCYTAGTYTLTGTSGGLVGYLRSNKGRTEKAEVHINDSYSVAVMNTDKTTVGLVGGNYAWKDAPANCSVEIKNSFFAGTAKYPIVNRGRGSGSGESDPGDMIVTTDNVYYLTGSATTESNLTPKATCEKNATAFADGTVRSLLNGATGDAWGQGATHPTLLPIMKLDDIQLSKGEINFVPLVYDYQVYLSNVIDSIKVTPVTDDATIAIKINGQDTQSGVGATIALADNDTTVIKVTITLAGLEKTYTISVTCVEGWDGASAIPFPNIDQEGAGTAENPFIISVPEHLAFLQKLAASTNVVKNDDTKITTTTVVVEGVTYTVSYPNSYLGNLYGAHFKITADINLNNKPWTFAEFRGRLDGGNHTIKNLNSASGFIAKLAYGSVSNLKVVGTVSGGSNVGGVVGQLAGGADLTNCSFSGTVTGTTNVGGLVGSTLPYDGTGAIFDITACSSTGTVTGTGAGLGGLVGSSGYNASYGGTLNLTDSYSAMTVATSASTVDDMAGLVGKGYVIYRNSYFAGQINSAYPIGFAAVDSIGSVYYKDGSCNTTTSANAGFIGGTKKTAAEFKSDAFVALLNKYAAPGVKWAKGTDYPTLTYTAPADGTTAPADPFYLSGLAIEHIAYKFVPGTFSYSFDVPYSANEIRLLPTAHPDLTITIDGQVVESEAISRAIALEVGVEKTIAVRVATGDSYTNYVVKLTRRVQPANGVWDGALQPFSTKNKAGETIDNPIIISTPGQLAFLSAMVNGEEVFLNGKIHRGPSANGNIYSGVYFEITADLVMNDVADYENWRTNAPANDFKPIGFHSDTEGVSRYFSGIINGNEHKITGLYISGKNSTGAGGTGLFGSINGGVARNVHVVKSYVKGGQRIGGIVGRPRSTVKLQNCVFSGIVESTYISTTSTSQVGGLVGDAVARVYIESCWTEGEVIGGNALGGLMGQLYMQTGAEIKNSYSTMTLSPQGGCDRGIGGLIGLLSGNSGTVDVFRSHFAGKVPTNTPFIGARSENCNAVITASDTVYYREDSYVGTVDEANTYKAVERTVEEFTDGTLTEELNNLIEYGDYWKWKTGDLCPVSDGVLLVTDYRDHTSDEHYDDGEWYVDFINKPGGTLKNPGSGNGNGSGDGLEDDDYLNSETGEASVASAVLILALISAVSAFLLARRKRSFN